MGACSSKIRAVFIHGSLTDRMSFVTIASTGDASDFGNLLSAERAADAASCASRVHGGLA